MKLSRRSMLGALGVGTLEAKRLGQQAAAQLSRISVGNEPGNNLGPIIKDNVSLQPSDKEWIDWQDAQKKAIEWAIGQKDKRAELESILYYQYRNISQLDPDLAYNNCYSMAAKLAYQRQRNVKREIENAMRSNSMWHQVEDWKRSVFTARGLFDRFAKWLGSDKQVGANAEYPSTNGRG